MVAGKEMKKVKELDVMWMQFKLEMNNLSFLVDPMPKGQSNIMGFGLR